MVAKLPNSDSRLPDRGLLASLTAYASQLLRPWMTWVLRYGPIPQHMAFIMDGNRRFASRLNKASTAGHEFGYLKVNPRRSHLWCEVLPECTECCKLCETCVAPLQHQWKDDLLSSLTFDGLTRQQ